LGWQVTHYPNIDVYEAIDEEGNPIIIGKDFSPATKIQDAWLVAENLNFDVKVTKYRNLKPKYQTHVFIPDNVKTEFADTAPMSICLATLKSVEVNIR
jgi:hypothetical protein